MEKRRIIKEDGRYLIFYSFSPQPGQEPAEKRPNTRNLTREEKPLDREGRQCPN